MFKFKRIMAVLLAVTVALSMAACGKPSSRTETSELEGTSDVVNVDNPDGSTDSADGSGGQSGSGSSGGQSGSGSSGSSGGSGGSDSSGGTNAKDKVVDKGSYKVHSTQFPAVTDGKCKITVMTTSSTSSDPGASSAAKAIEEKLGIDVDWQVYGYSTIYEKWAAMRQSGNLPDIFVSVNVGLSRNQALKDGKQKLIADLTNYVETWAPNANKFINSSGVNKYINYSDNGKLYALPGYSVLDGKLSETNLEERMLFINTDWLDELGLKAPTTVDEFYKVCKAFTEEDPDGNGKDDTYGFGIPLMTPQLWNPWGLGMNWYNVTSIDSKGKVSAGPLTDNFRAGIRFWNRLWNDGYWNTAMIGGYTTKEIRKTGIVSDYDLSGELDASELDKWEYINWPKGNAKDCGDFTPGASGYITFTNCNPNMLVISGKTKHLEACLRFCDYLYTNEGAMIWKYGAEKTTWTKIGDNYKLIKNYEAKLKTNAIDSSVVIGQPSNILPKNNAEKSVKELFTGRRDKDVAAKGIMGYSATSLKYFYTAAESESLDALKNATGSVSWGYDAIMGKDGANVETGWNNYISQYPNYSQWKKIVQPAVDRMFKYSK